MFSTTSNTPWLNKVPEVTALFWIIKIMSTTVGETAADYLDFNLQLGLSMTSVVVGALLLVSLFFQFSRTKYIPAIYWMTVALVSVFGTLVTDNLTDHFGVPLTSSSVAFALILLGIFAFWFLKEKTLSIHAIDTRRREMFYWLAIFVTFALGTAVGDCVAEEFQWGYADAGMIFGGLIVLTTAMYYLFKSNAVTCFWLAYILTRPLGASLGDFLTQPISNGGLGLESMAINLAFLSTMLLIVIYLSHQQSKLKAITS